MTKDKQKIIDLACTPEEVVEKMNFKEKQAYYKARSKVGKMIHYSNSDTGGITYRRRDKME